jgi:hypothetical protein
MSSRSTHRAKHLFRHVIAAGITVLYLLTIFSPLASFAMHGSKSTAMAIRECSGDCNLCGCSPESRASQTCCCSKKRAQQAHDHDQDGASDCCSKMPDQQASTHEHVDNSTPDCCTKVSAPQKPAIISCGCPCGNGKQPALSISSSSEVLPFHFSGQFTTRHTTTSFFTLTHLLTTRHSEPPDPPPKLV